MPTPPLQPRLLEFARESICATEADGAPIEIINAEISGMTQRDVWFIIEARG